MTELRTDDLDARPGPRSSSARSSARTPRLQRRRGGRRDGRRPSSRPSACGGPWASRTAAASGAFTRPTPTPSRPCSAWSTTGSSTSTWRSTSPGRSGRPWPGSPTGRSPPCVHRVQEIEAGDDATGSPRHRRAADGRGAERARSRTCCVYVWRRHLAAAVGRVEALGAAEEDLHTSQMTVGFADIVSFTALTNQLAHDRIGDLVEIFESRCADVVASQHGRVIKSLGDAVLFVNDRPDPRLRHRRGDHHGGRPRPPDARRPRRAGHADRW